MIAGDPAPTLARLAATMKDCADFRIEVGGHTDAQGSEAFNAELSRRRAQAILEAMTESGIDTRFTTARGYGESQPIAGNDTDAGREANRRIEFTLTADDPVVTDIPKPAELVQGVTDSAEEVAPAFAQGRGGDGEQFGHGAHVFLVSEAGDASHVIAFELVGPLGGRGGGLCDGAEGHFAEGAENLDPGFGAVKLREPLEKSGDVLI